MKDSNNRFPNKFDSSSELSQYLHDVLAGDLLHLQFMFHKIESSLDKQTFVELNQELSLIRNKVRSLSHELLSAKETYESVEDVIQYLLVDYTYVLPAIQFSLFKFPKNSQTKFNDSILSEFKYIFKELINNAITHGKSDEIEINVIVHSESISIAISDNGIGFDLKQTKNQGIGLKNTKKRVDKIGGTIIIDSVIGRGSIISIDIPV